jgi:hypothetical protein
MVGSDTKWAEYKRLERAENKLLDIVQIESKNCPTEIRVKRLELDKERIPVDKQPAPKKPQQKNPAPDKEEVAEGVLLSKDELAKLEAKFGAAAARERICNYSLSKKMHGYKYKSDYAAMLVWARKDPPAAKPKERPKCAVCGGALTGGICYAPVGDGTCGWYEGRTG